jgi:hypothetical protein
MAVAGFMAAFNSFRLMAQISCLRASPNLYLISPSMDLVVILACLFAAWLLANSQKNIFAFNYFGTRFYGRSRTDQGYITTKWLVAIFPVLPIRSYIVEQLVSQVNPSDIEFQRDPAHSLEGYVYLPQVIRTALISYGTIFWIWWCLWLMLNSNCLKVAF